MLEQNSPQCEHTGGEQAGHVRTAESPGTCLPRQMSLHLCALNAVPGPGLMGSELVALVPGGAEDGAPGAELALSQG